MSHAHIARLERIIAQLKVDLQSLTAKVASLAILETSHADIAARFSALSRFLDQQVAALAARSDASVTAIHDWVKTGWAQQEQYQQELQQNQRDWTTQQLEGRRSSNEQAGPSQPPESAVPTESWHATPPEFRHPTSSPPPLRQQEHACQADVSASLAIRGLQRSPDETSASLLQAVVALAPFRGSAAAIVSVRRHHFLQLQSGVVEVVFVTLASKMAVKRESWRLRGTCISLDHFLTAEQLRQRGMQWMQLGADWARANGYRCVWSDVSPTKLLVLGHRASPPPPPPPRPQ